MEHIAEVGCIAAARPEIVDGSRCNGFVSVEVLGTNARTGAAVNGLGHEGDVVRNAVGIGFRHAGHSTFGVLQNHRGSVNILGCAGDVGLQRDVHLSQAAEVTRSGHFNCCGVNGTFNELHRRRTRNDHVLRVGHDNIGEDELTRSVGVDTDGVVLNGHAREFNSSCCSRCVLEGRTSGTGNGTRDIATNVGLVVHTSNELVLQVHVHEVDLT